MRALQALLFISLFICIASAAGNDSTEGGNVSGVNVTAQQNSTWHGVCGKVTPNAFTPVVINATPGGITCLTIHTGSSQCSRGTGYINLLFSNSSQNITSLARGNLTLLDQFISRPGQNASATFAFSTAFPTRRWGVITGVPTTYTKSPNPTAFRMGYLNDQSKNIVIIARVSGNQTGFNGSVFDFQLMLPTRNGTTTPYYLTVDFACTAPPSGGGGGGGGGTGTPYNQTNATPPVVPPVTPPITPGNITNITNCTIPELFCGEWGPCVDGYRRQSCRDTTGCSEIEVFRVEKCIGPAKNETKPGKPPEEIEKIFVAADQWWFCLALLILLAVVLAAYVIRKKRRDPDKGTSG